MGKYVDDLVCMIQEAERLEISDSMRHTVELCSALFDVLSNADSAWVPAAAREQAGMLFTIVRKAVGKAEAALVERGAWVGPTSMPMPADASAELPMAPTTGAPPPPRGAPPPTCRESFSSKRAMPSSSSLSSHCSLSSQLSMQRRPCPDRMWPERSRLSSRHVFKASSVA